MSSLSSGCRFPNIMHWKHHSMFDKLVNELQLYIIEQLTDSQPSFQNQLDSTYDRKDIQMYAVKIGREVSAEIAGFVSTLINKGSQKTKIEELTKQKIKQKLETLGLKEQPELLKQTGFELLRSALPNKMLKSEVQSLENVWSQSRKQVTKCQCFSVGDRFTQQKCRQFCYRCGKRYHPYCFWPKKNDAYFECPFCFIRNCLPDNQVTAIIFAGYLSLNSTQTKVSKIKFDVPQWLLCHKKLKIQLRCVKLCDSHRFRICFPDACSISLNNSQDISLKPLGQTSPIFIRYDEPIELLKSCLKSRNTIILKEELADPQTFKVTAPGTHILFIVASRRLEGKQEIYNHLLKYRSTADCQSILEHSLLSKQCSDVEVQKISISLRCQFYGTSITHPGRSYLCSTHYQPFDVKNLIYSSLQARSSHKKWTCPICGKRVYHIYLDTQILNLISSSVSQIEFAVGQPPKLKFSKQEEFADDSNADSQIQVPNKTTQVHSKIEQISAIDQPSLVCSSNLNNLNLKSTGTQKQLFNLISSDEDQEANLGGTCSASHAH